MCDAERDLFCSKLKNQGLGRLDNFVCHFCSGRMSSELGTPEETHFCSGRMSSELETPAETQDLHDAKDVFSPELTELLATEVGAVRKQLSQWGVDRVGVR